MESSVSMITTNEIAIVLYIPVKSSRDSSINWRKYNTEQLYSLATETAYSLAGRKTGSSYMARVA
jgi:hypothetical protein